MMKNVIREAEPAILKKNKKKWTKDLMTAVKSYHRTGKRVPSYLQERYRKDEIKDTLKRMYSDQEENYFCCYCETEIDIVDYPHIEHKMPKDPDMFPEQTYEWDNLHLVCTKCNGNKRNLWDNAHPILDAAIDIPVSDHMAYTVDYTGIYRQGLTDRGNTTIEHAKLNRKKLLKARQKIYFEVLKAIQEIILLKNDPRISTYKEILNNKAAGPFGSFIQWSLEDWKIIE